MVNQVWARCIGVNSREKQVPRPPSEDRKRDSEDRDPGFVMEIQDAISRISISTYILGLREVKGTHRSLKLIITTQTENARSPMAKSPESFIIGTIP